ncbi:MAG: DUF58 domain-containing protein [Clostridiales bacterium]|nr:DUF58 domain-containing protein [Clostridiales bacterium]
MNGFVILIILAAVYCILGVLLTKFGLKGLQCHRTFSRQTAFAGEEGELVEVVRNDRPMVIPWLRMESSLSPHIQLGRQDNVNISEARHYSSLFTLMPYQQVRRRHRVRFLHRGSYDLGNATLTVGDLFGLFQSNREQSMHVPVLVFPRLLDEREMPIPLSLLLGDASAQRQLLTDPFLVRGIRDYQMGDPVRDIHWPATARMGQAQVRLFEHTTRMKLMVILNGQLTEEQWGSKLMDYEEESIEYGISVAATMCVWALRNGLMAGFAANLPIDKGVDSVVLPPGGGPAREEELLTAFARLSILRTQSFKYFLSTLTDLTDLDIIVLSCYDSEEMQLGLEKLRRQNNRVMLHVLEGQQGGAA